MASLRCVRSSVPADDRGSVWEFREIAQMVDVDGPFNVFRLSAGERRIATSRDNHYAGLTHAAVIVRRGRRPHGGWLHLIPEGPYDYFSYTL